MRLGFYTLAVSERDDNGNPDEMKVVFFNSLSLHDDVHRGGSSDGSGRSGYGMPYALLSGGGDRSAEGMCILYT